MNTSTQNPDTYFLRCQGYNECGRIQPDGSISMTADTGQINYVIGTKIQIENSIGYDCCMNEYAYEIWEVNNFIQNTEIIFQLKKNRFVEFDKTLLKCADEYTDSMGVKHQLYVNYLGQKHSYGEPIHDECHYDENGFANEDGIVFLKP